MNELIDSEQLANVLILFKLIYTKKQANKPRDFIDCTRDYFDVCINLSVLYK